MEMLDNNQGKRLGDSLRATLDDDAKLSIISAHFSLFAYGELREELERLDSVRVLFNEPTFIRDMKRRLSTLEFDIAQRAQGQREKALAESSLELTLRNKLNQRALARACASWLRKKVTLRSVRRENVLQYPPSYVIEGAAVSPHLFAGQGATFTLEGLGVARRPDTLTMITHFSGDEAKAQVEFLMAQFESVWANDEATCDVTEQVVEQVEAMYADNAPEFIYFLTLYHIFRRFLQETRDHNPREDTGFFDSVIWGKLYDFQKDAVIGAIRKLEKYNGCIIADSVGLGKTFEALAVIKYYQQLNKNVLVLCPKRLRENWTLWMQASDERNPLAADRFNYKVLNHTDLSRRRGKSGDTDLEHLQWGTFDLLVIDESHRACSIVCVSVFCLKGLMHDE
ncbi:MAG: SNF2-related protein [Actinomyces sp.]|nr:SNF2-related protein [Actinomyces sp.]